MENNTNEQLEINDKERLSNKSIVKKKISKLSYELDENEKIGILANRIIDRIICDFNKKIVKN